MKKVLVFFVCLLVAQVRVMAQDIQVQPSPRQVNVTGKSMTIPVAFRSWENRRLILMQSPC